MCFDDDLYKRGLLIVTGSTVKAEYYDRPMAYRLKDKMEKILGVSAESPIVVISDLWYLNSEILQSLPVISIGGPGVNAVSSHFYKRLETSMVIDDTLIIQMDPVLEDLRVGLWGRTAMATEEAVRLFMDRGYLCHYLDVVAARQA